jgi:hypothetical protein
VRVEFVDREAGISLFFRSSVSRTHLWIEWDVEFFVTEQVRSGRGRFSFL